MTDTSRDELLALSDWASRQAKDASSDGAAKWFARMAPKFREATSATSNINGL